MRFLNSLRASCPPDHGWRYVTNDKSREWSGSLSLKPVKNSSELSDDFFSHQLISDSTPATTTSEWKFLVDVNKTTEIVALTTLKTASIGSLNVKPIKAKPKVSKYENRTELSDAKSRQETIETIPRSEITTKIFREKTTTTVENFTTFPQREVKPARCPERVYLSGTSSLHKR